ncbi:hypothetical protein Tsubulata_011669 [Turnera subulata]|uniref:YABBY N-terminal domain-containing protein n=1 Tax=Turnera subulata TaxID=218843 RepID=A0A9Q0JIV5_9ROSI|nr:hypothetical protein Tsubulata_011669 [Turnera subulata]
MSSSSTLSLDHLPAASEQLCYVHCNICDTVLAVSVPCTSLFKTVTVRCGHCTNLLPVNMRGLIFPSANQFHLSHSFFTPPSTHILDEIQNPSPNFFINQTNANDFGVPVRGMADHELPRPPVINRREFIISSFLAFFVFFYLKNIPYKFT